ncbi:hypothetical protein IEO21_09774 [Rhodonia placenta]|uniref:HNH nuclease domain-containing protein n=1 Tax=Rhodonia placenta TaxID=104341 RepID=A0A8H7TXY1_9APHY|nr:hypothetical protein IEO21_09774 [Postia placenta]
MVGGFKPRRSNRLKHLPKVDYCENKTADGKRKRGELDEEGEYTPSREGTPENERTKTRAPQNERTPSRRVSRKAAITKDARQRAVDASQNEGACIISGMKDKSVQQCHVLPRATKPDVVSSSGSWAQAVSLTMYIHTYIAHGSRVVVGHQKRAQRGFTPQPGFPCVFFPVGMPIRVGLLVYSPCRSPCLVGSWIHCDHANA